MENIILDKKFCNKCSSLKVIEEFHFKNKEKGIKQCWCKKCMIKARISYYKNNSDKEKEYDKKRTDGLRQKLYDYLLKHPCRKCEEKDPVVLQFDHQKEKEYNISEMVQRGKSWENILKEIDKCIVLCANCHARKTAKQFNWYSRITQPDQSTIFTKSESLV